MTPAEEQALAAGMRLLRPLVRWDADRARHEPDTCTHPVMDRDDAERAAAAEREPRS